MLFARGRFHPPGIGGPVARTGPGAVAWMFRGWNICICPEPGPSPCGGFRMSLVNVTGSLQRSFCSSVNMAVRFPKTVAN